MNQFAKRLQSRLSAKGHRFSMAHCRYALNTNAQNPESPTEDEMITAFNWLASSESTAGELATVEPETEVIIAVPNASDIPVENLPCLQPPELPAENQPQPAEQEGALEVTGAQNDLSKPSSPDGVLNFPSHNLTSGAISQAQVTQAITQAVAQVGASGNAEAIELLTSLAKELSTDIKDVEEMASALITAYLGKRQNILASAIGTVQNLRSAQTSSFQSGLNQDFFDHKERNKRQFLNSLQGMFN